MRWQWWKKSRVACAMIAVQLAFAGMNIVSKVAMSAGLPFYVLVVYRHAVATVALAPFAYFLERKTRPRLSGRVLMEIFTSALLGSSLNQNLYYAGMHYTSPTFVCALANMVPAITFLMALLFRMEKLALRSAAGQAKVIGTTVTVAGGMIITLYKGPALNLWKSSLNVAPSVATSHPNYSPMKGALLALGSCICFSCWFIVQAKIGSSYSAQYTSITLMFFFATIQATVGALLFQHSRPSVWKMGWDSKLLAVIYSGVVCSAMGFMLMAWCIRKKGPLIVTMFTPFQLIMVALLSSVFLRDKLHLGSVAGSLLIIAGVYSVVWAKTKEFNSQKKQIPTTAMSNNKIICAPSEDYDNVADGASVAAGEERNPDCDDAKPGSAGDSTVLVGVRVVVGGGDGRTEAGRRGESDER